MLKIVPISEVRSKLTKFIKEIQKGGEPIIITQRSHADAMLVNRKFYEKLVERIQELEELEDLQDLLSAQKEYSPEEAIPYEEYRHKRLKKSV